MTLVGVLEILSNLALYCAVVIVCTLSLSDLHIAEQAHLLEDPGPSLQKSSFNMFMSACDRMRVGLQHSQEVLWTALAMHSAPVVG